MPEEPIVQDPVATPPELPKEFVFTYQPKDENGNPLGGVQVIKAANPEEALQKMAEQNSELVKLNRKLNKDLRLGNIIPDNIPETAPRVAPGQYEFNPVPLSAEERLEVIRDINDPENFDKAAERIVKATIGDPQAIRNVLSQSQTDVAAMRAKAEAEAFVRSNPDYYVCAENVQTIFSWMIKNELQPVKDNFQLAYDTLGPNGSNVLVARPAAVEPPPPPPVVDPTPAAAEPAAPTRNLPPVLSRRNSSESGAARSNDSGITYEYRPNPNAAPIVFKGKEALERMPGDEYKRRLLHEKGFKEAVEKLDKQSQRQPVGA